MSVCVVIVIYSSLLKSVATCQVLRSTPPGFSRFRGFLVSLDYIEKVCLNCINSGYFIFFWLCFFTSYSQKFILHYDYGKKSSLLQKKLNLYILVSATDF